jgi:hypothetical protein
MDDLHDRVILLALPVLLGAVAVILWAPAGVGFAAAAGTAAAWCRWAETHRAG